MIVAKTSLGYFTQTTDLRHLSVSTTIHDSWLRASRFSSEADAHQALARDGYAHLNVAFENAETYPVETAGRWPTPKDKAA